MDSKPKPHAPSDAETSSQRGVSRRSLLGIIGIAAGASVVMAAATSPGAMAAKLKGKTQHRKGPIVPPWVPTEPVLMGDPIYGYSRKRRTLKAR